MTGHDAPTLSPLALPRSKALTDALLAGGVPPGPTAVAAVRRVLERAFSGVAGAARGPLPCLRVRAFDLVRADEIAPGVGAPFRWTARTARRRVGLAALRRCLSDPDVAPADAVARVLADPASPAGTGPGGPGSCADWLAGLSPAARTVVQAEATTWATSVWTAIEWDRTGPTAVVGGPDRWWDWRGSHRIALQGRADVRIPGPAGAQLVVLDGFPSEAARRALCFGPLVDALRSGGVDTPSRIVAWWPDCGKAWVTVVDEHALRACADQVVRWVSRNGAVKGDPPAAAGA